MIRLTQLTRLTRRQRRALMALGFANAIALSALALLLLRTPAPPDAPHLDSPIAADPHDLELCRVSTSRALLDAGRTGLVHTQRNGIIHIQLQRRLVSDSLRLDVDSAVWSALEAVAREAGCLKFNELQVTVILYTPADKTEYRDIQYQSAHAFARVAIPDLMLWSLGEIDDRGLALRLDYAPPTSPSLSLPPLPSR